MKNLTQEINQNYINALNEASKELIKLTDIDISKVDVESVHHLKKQINAKGFKLSLMELPSNAMKHLITMYFKDEFIAGYILELDLQLNVIRRKLMESEKEIREVLLGNAN